MSGDPDAQIARRLRLRAELPQAVRLSPRVLAALAGSAAVAVGISAVVAVRPTAAPPDPQPAVAARPAPPEALAALPKDYSELRRDAPKLGPPRPVFDLLAPSVAEADGEAPARVAVYEAVPPGGDPGGAGGALLRARESGLFAEGVRAPAPDRPLPGEGPGAGEARERGSGPSKGPASAQGAAGRGTSAVLQAGTIIAAALITGIRSDLPGPVTAQVTEPVYDSLSGRRVLIPAGARLLGDYDSADSPGQERVRITWNRLLLPDGRAFDLGGLPAADLQGHVGLSGRADHGWARLAGAALVSALLGVGTELVAQDESDAVLRALGRAAGDAGLDAGRQVIGRELQVKPRLRIRPGHPVLAVLVRDLDLGGD